MARAMNPHGAAAQVLLGKSGAVARWACPRHKIEYALPAQDKAECPACDRDEVIADLRASLIHKTNILDDLEVQLDRAKAKVDSVYAMQSTLDLLEVADRTFIKAALYRWRADKGVAIRVIHAASKGPKDKPAAVGFIADYRDTGPVGLNCTSIGGVMLAAFYEEAQRAHGDAEAMKLLARALNPLLQGGIG